MDFKDKTRLGTTLKIHILDVQFSAPKKVKEDLIGILSLRVDHFRTSYTRNCIVNTFFMKIFNHKMDVRNI